MDIEIELNLLFEAIDSYLEVKPVYDKARSECDSSWDYYGSEFIDALDKSKIAVREAIETLLAKAISDYMEENFASLLRCCDTESE